MTLLFCEFQPYQVEIPPCGTVKIVPSLKSVKSGQTIVFTANFTGVKGKLLYYWFTDRGKIIGSSSGKTLTVSTKNFSGKMTVSVDVKPEGTSCEQVYAEYAIEVKK